MRIENARTRYFITGRPNGEWWIGGGGGGGGGCGQGGGVPVR